LAARYRQASVWDVRLVQQKYFLVPEIETLLDPSGNNVFIGPIVGQLNTAEEAFVISQ
jgi:hypothetical protein